MKDRMLMDEKVLDERLKQFKDDLMKEDASNPLNPHNSPKEVIRLYCGCGNWLDVNKETVPMLKASSTSCRCPHCDNIFFNFEASL